MSRPRIWQPVTKICKFCKNEFFAESRYAIQRQIYCDRTCRSRDLGNGKSVHLIEKNCEFCDKQMRLWPSKPQRFCSLECRGKWQKKTGERAGPNNPAWQGGTGNNGSYWKRQARKRDSNRCQVKNCKTASERTPHAHHKIPRKVGGPDTLDNLITLCGKHHGQFERKLFNKLMMKFPKATAKIATKIYDRVLKHD